MYLLKGRPKPPIPDIGTGTWITVLPGQTEYEFWLISGGTCRQAYNLFDPPAGFEKTLDIIAGDHNIGYESLVISEKVLNEWPDDAGGQNFCEYCRNEANVVPLAFHDQFMTMIEEMKKKVIIRQRDTLPPYYAPFFRFV